MESITDELREWASSNLSYKTRFDELVAIADRIDAEHERDVTAAHSNGITEYGSMVAREYAKLPVDADGVPIRVGDHVEETDASLIGRARGEVIRIVFGKHGTDVRIDTGLSYADRNPWSLRHISKPPTVEDVLDEMLQRFAEDSYEGGLTDFIASYATKLQLKEDR